MFITQKTRINITAPGLRVLELLSSTLYEYISFKVLGFKRKCDVHIIKTKITKSIKYNTLHRLKSQSNADLMNHD